MTIGYISYDNVVQSNYWDLRMEILLKYYILLIAQENPWVHTSTATTVS